MTLLICDYPVAFKEQPEGVEICHCGCDDILCGAPATHGIQIFLENGTSPGWCQAEQNLCLPHAEQALENIERSGKSIGFGARSVLVGYGKEASA